jgi:hypothetical protein
MRTVVLFSALLAACGGASSRTSESALAESGGGETPAAGHPIRTTTPIPVPQPAVPRESLSPALQRVWERVEVAVAIRPPEPPANATLEVVNQWAEGPFVEWLLRRAQASQEAQTATNDLEEAPAHERGIAAGLVGYLQEDTCADVRGAPIPESIAGDAELLGVYDRSLHEALLPYARVAVQAYRFCIAAFEETQDPVWAEWQRYCGERGSEVAAVFGVDADATATAASE